MKFDQILSFIQRKAMNIIWVDTLEKSFLRSIMSIQAFIMCLGRKIFCIEGQKKSETCIDLFLLAKCDTLYLFVRIFFQAHRLIMYFLGLLTPIEVNSVFLTKICISYRIWQNLELLDTFVVGSHVSNF